MSDLTFAERDKFERLLGMASGYVLDFTNRTFAELVLDSTGQNIFDHRYDNGSGSKANRLRMFWQKENNQLVGKLMGDILDYHGETGPKVEMCRLIVARLKGTLNSTKATTEPLEKPPEKPVEAPPVNAHAPVTAELWKLKQEFDGLATEKDRAKAGLALERLLHRLFVLFSLQPRQPFKVVGEQIDGSFELDRQIYLLESKWEKAPLPEADLLVFGAKIEKKSTFTRGVFIALNGISSQAKQAITQGKAPSFIVMDGHDLMMILSEAISLPEFLRRRVRLLAEEGCVCVPFSELT